MAVSSLFAAGTISGTEPEIRLVGGELRVDMQMKLDSIKLGSNQQIYITPIVQDDKGNKVALPTVLAQGRNMHYAWERGSIDRNGKKDYTIYTEVRRLNGKPQTIDYSAGIPYEQWMFDPSTHLVLTSDSCGCGKMFGSRVGDSIPVDINPWRCMVADYVTPEVTALPVSIHEGRARVQFEVDRTELHTEPYVCRSGQRIDNREQLRVIADSISYALSDPNVEIASINICGYASPESPYLHNEELSTGRSRALSEYIAQAYKLPADRSTYSSVPENWGEFRQQVVDSKELTEEQRRDLLELIDRPAYGPSDYDAKERELKTSPRFAKLYRSTILPKWFPQLRATVFQISTRLKPMPDEDLAKVIAKTPEKMSLNQMMRVARLYPDGSPEFNKVIDIALEYYPLDPTANLNGAVAAFNSGNYERAAQLISHAGDSADADNLRGILAARSGDFTKARSYFDKAAAANSQLARRNLSCMENL